MRNIEILTSVQVPSWLCIPCQQVFAVVLCARTSDPDESDDWVSFWGNPGTNIHCPRCGGVDVQRELAKEEV